MQLIDTHNHIVPGIDDGSRDLSETIKMCEIALEEDIKKIVATPHFIIGEYETSADEIRELVQRINNALKEKNIDITVLPGHEVFVDPSIPKLLLQNQICTINNSKYLLIELPMHSIPNYMEELLYSIRIKGYIPIIAHPERNMEIIGEPNLLFRFIELGALAQLTTWSILGNYGKEVRETAEILLEHNMYHLIATDAHSCNKRRPKLQKALRVTQELIGVEKLNLIVNNANLVIADDEVKKLPAELVKKQRGIKSLFKIFNR